MRAITGSWLARVAAAAIGASLLLAPIQSLGDGAEPPIAVVVGRTSTPAEAISQTLVLGIFGRKRQLWNDRSVIVPINLPALHPLRRNFSLWVFKKSPEQLQDYWNEQYFHGVLPPRVLASEEAVMRFVASTPDAVGYVSSCSVDERVVVVALIVAPDGTANCPR